MRRADIIRFWEWDNLRRWSTDSLRHLLVPASSKSFLAEVGLPWRAGQTIRFDDQAHGLPRLPNKPHYRRIGFDYDVPICLDEGRDGCVVEAGEEFGYPERYINSSVELFGECLVYFQRCLLKGQAAREGDVAALIARTARLLRKADPEAFADENSWWPVIIEDWERWS